MVSREGLGRAGTLLASLLAVTVVAALGGLLTNLGLGPWYDALPKPSWNPPAWVFGPVWTTLYALQAVAAWLVATSPAPGARRALACHGAQLALNVAWSGVFFALRSPRAAVLVLALVAAALVATVVSFRRVKPLAALLVAPTLAWVAFATALNVAIASRL